jgi:hypothetical protein
LQYFDSSLCVNKRQINDACLSSIECNDNKGFECSSSSSKCDCVNSKYYNSAICGKKNEKIKKCIL